MLGWRRSPAPRTSHGVAWREVAPVANSIPDDFVPGLEGVVAFTTEIAEPDKNGGNLRYRGVDIEDLVENAVTFADVLSLIHI